MYPFDEEQGAKGIRKSDNIVNYAPTITPIGANLSREDRIAALLPKLPAELQKYIKTGGAPKTAAQERDENFARYGTGLPSGVQVNAAGHKDALAEADKYLAVAGHMQGLRNDIETRLDSADFLKEFSKLDHTTPNFDATTAKLFSQFPRASGPAIENAMQSLGAARQTYLQGVAPGGADAYDEGTPERTAYINRLHQTKGNTRAADAHAKNVQKGEEMVKLALANGLLDLDKDFPKWDGNEKTKPAVYNSDGSVNYHEVGLLAAKNAATYGKIAKDEDAAEQRDLRTIQQFADADMRETNKDVSAIYSAAATRQATREQKRKGETTQSKPTGGAKRYTSGL